MSAQQEGEVDKCIKTIHVTDCQDIDIDTTYGTETMANAIALAISKRRGLQEQVYTDSKSLVDAVPTLQKKLKKASADHTNLLASIHESTTNKDPAPPPLWVKAHPLISQSDKWSRRQWGNHIADRVAANQQDEIYTPRTKTQYAAQGSTATINKPCKIPITTITFKASDIYPKLIPIDAWYWGDHLGKPLGVKPIKHYLHQHDLSNYVEERDKYRQDYHDKHNPGEPPIHSQHPQPK